MIDPNKTTPEKLAEMNDSLIVDNNYLRERIAELSAERDNLLVQVGDNDCDALREYAARVIALIIRHDAKHFGAA